MILVVSGNSLSIDELVVYINQLESFKGGDFVIKEEHWDYPIKVGFEVITNKKIVNSVNHNQLEKLGNDV